jgi:hypothetical protein
MHDALDACDRRLDFREAREIGLHEGLVRTEVRRPRHVAEPEVGIHALQQLAQPRADAARRAGDQNRLHGFARSRT